MKKAKTKRAHSRMPLVLGALLIIVLITAAWQPQLTGRVVSSAYCHDRDGDDPFTASETVATPGTADQEFFDTCFTRNSVDYLVEYTCNENRLAPKLYECPCSNGYCLTVPS